MANKIILKKSSVAAKAPVAGDLDFGELAINYTDSKLYFKKADGNIDAFTTATAAVTSVGGNIGAITDTQLLTSIKNVDGAGSGLDADLLDGNHASAFYLASNPNGYTSNTGTVTSVGATSPLVSSGGNTPSLSIPAATSSVNGYMSAAYASKLDGIAAGATANTGTVTSVNATGGYGGLTLSGTVTTSGSLTLGGTPTGTWPISVSGNAATAAVLETSRTINGTAFNGSSNIDTTEWYHSDRDFPNGTLITTNINYAVSSGDPFVLEIRGNSYGNIIPLDLLYQGYIYSDTIINHGGISNGLNITGLVAINNGGNLCFWFPSQGYWNGYNVKVYTAYATRATNRVTSITGVAKPTTAKEVALSANIRQSLHSGNYTSYTMPSDSSATNSVDVRAPIFYDSNDTGYYINPNSGSRLYDLNIEGASHKYLYINPGNGYEAMVRYNGGSGSGWYVGKRTASVLVGTESFHFYSEAAGATVGGIDTSGNIFASASHRAPIFYDNNDTGYYIDPNSTSDTALRMRGGALFGPNTSWGAYLYVGGNGRVGTEATVAVTNGNLHLDSKNGYQMYLNWYSTEAVWTGGNLGVGAASASHRLHVHGTGYATSDFRAPIFYDSDNTGYYIDPNSNSVLNTFQTAGAVVIGGNFGNNAYNAVGSTRLLFGGGNDQNAYYLGTNLNNYGGNYTKLDLAWHTGIRMGAQMQYGGIRFFNSESLITQIFSIGETDSNVRVSSALYTPITYDSNDTGYYIDPASTSVLNRISTVRTNDWLYIDNNYGHSVVGAYSSYRYQGVFAMGDAYKLPADGTTTGNLYGMAWSHPNAGGIAANLNSHGLLLLQNGGFMAALSTNGTFSADVRGTIFYDYSNTGYYVDPNAVSYLYGLTLAGGSYFRPQNWIQMDGSYGMYWPNHYGAHLRANDLSTYTQIALSGSKNSYSGIYDQASGVNIGMFDGAGNGGIYREANGRWFSYYNISNDCWGFGTSSTDSAYNLYAPKGIYSGGRVDGTIFYDSNNTGYYTDPASNSNFNITQTISIRETRSAIAASAIDVNSGNYFTKTITAATTFTVNAASSGSVSSFILELTNAGSAAITWFSGVKWAGGTAPALTSAGVDILGFYTHDGGTTWRGMVLAKDSK